MYIKEHSLLTDSKGNSQKRCLRKNMEASLNEAEISFKNTLHLKGKQKGKPKTIEMELPKRWGYSRVKKLSQEGGRL